MESAERSEVRLSKSVSAGAEIPEEWSFAVVGDTQGASLAEPVSPVFDLIIEKINSLKGGTTPEPDFVVHLGDKVAGSADQASQGKQFSVYQEKKARFVVPVYEVAGNHDIPKAEIFPVYEAMISPNLYYSFDHKGYHFVVLCSEKVPGMHSSLGQEQIAWLEEDLKAHSDAGLFFVFLHRPLYRGIIQPGTLRDSEKLEKILKRYKVKYLFVGHEHRFGINRRSGLTEYISGGGGAPLLNFSEESGGYYHFLMVKVKGKDVEVDPVKIDYPKRYQSVKSLWQSFQRLRH
ncbi:MAG: metallophosphoesterase [Candidatus Omnitrophota bacterium]